MGKACKLVIMDAGPIIKLAVIRRLDLLFSFDLTVHIPDEVLFEAIEKQAWMESRPLSADKRYLQDWVEKHKNKQVVPEETFIGSSARQGRDAGALSPESYPPNLGELSADSVFLRRTAMGYSDNPAVLMVDDYDAIEMFRLKNADVYIFTTFSFLLQLEKDQLIGSAENVWAEIVDHLPTAGKMLDPDPSGPVRKGATARMRPRPK